ncbi:H(+)-transporting V0 sector ATPase subunit a, partial [Conglomerata obtusa]
AISQLGTHSLVQFLNLNAHLKIENLPFNKEIRLLEKLKSKVNYLEQQTQNKQIKLVSESDYISAHNLSEDVEKHFERIVFLNEIKKETVRKLQDLNEDLVILEALDDYLAINSSPECVEECKVNLDYVCFVVSKEKSFILERVLGQSLRNNLIMHKEERIIELPEFSGTIPIDIYIVFTHGKSALMKIENVVSGLGGRVLSRKSIDEGTLSLSTHIGQVVRIYQNNERALESLSQIILGKMNMWRYAVNKEMRIYQTMNKLGFEKGRECLIGKGWVRKVELKTLDKVCKFICKKYGCITFEIETFYNEEESHENEFDYDDLDNNSVHYNLCNKSFNKNKNLDDKKIDDNKNTVVCKNNPIDRNNENIEKIYNSDYTESQENFNFSFTASTPQLKESCSNTSLLPENTHIVEIPPKRINLPLNPPTYYKTNKFTAAFQDISNVYGIPHYKEINPAYFYITTFPFMFGAMFGDIGHGIMLLGIAFFLIRNEKNIKLPEFAEIIFHGRYLILMCSFWSIFFGFIYSDFLSLSLHLFKSQFVFDSTGKGSRIENYTYPFGLDPGWHGTKQGIQFINSMKMKMSIIFAFCHMSLGILISFLNAFYRKDKIAIFCVLIPQSLAFFSFVGYLVFLIIYKWLVLSDHPGLINVLVSMFTSPFTVEQEIYPFQKQFQLFLFSIVVISIPWMLFSKPMYDTMQYNKKKNRKRRRIKEAEMEEGFYTNHRDNDTNKNNTENLVNRNNEINANINQKNINNNEVIKNLQISKNDFNNKNGIQSDASYDNNKVDDKNSIVDDKNSEVDLYNVNDVASNNSLIKSHKNVDSFKSNQNRHKQNENEDKKDTNDVQNISRTNSEADNKKASTKIVSKESSNPKKQQKTLEGPEEEEGLVEIWMHQCIETVEFLIGLVSNTSSYLRLWAISLAHSQLTQVLHQMTIGASPLFLIITFPVYVFFTVSLLIGLEGLSSVLHALRLNWIEFNCKFFKGGGELFSPLNYEIKEDDE